MCTIITIMQSSLMVTGIAPKISLFNSDRNQSVPIRYLPDLCAGFFRRKSIGSALNWSNSDKISVQSTRFSKFGPIHSESKYVIWAKPFNSCEMSRKTLHPIKERFIYKKGLVQMILSSGAPPFYSSFFSDYFLLFFFFKGSTIV